MTDQEIKEYVQTFTTNYFAAVNKQHKRMRILDTVVSIAREYGAKYALTRDVDDCDQVIIEYAGLGFGSIIASLIEDRLDGVDCDTRITTHPASLTLTFTLVGV